MSKMTRIARDLALHVGLDVHRASKHRNGYETVAPRATYAPWRVDQGFLDAYTRIKTFTLVDEFRCYELWTLIPQTQHLQGALLEVGVWRGGSGTLIARRAIECGITEPVYLCDTFVGVVKASSKDSNYVGGEHADTSKDTVLRLLASEGLDNAHILPGIFPDETGSLVTSRYFRFCHIDVDVYESAKDAADWLWPKMPPGAIIVYDDYGFQGCDGVTRLVNEQVHLSDRIIIHNLNGHAVVVKIA